MDESVNISSFIVRIVHSKTTAGSYSYRGSIRHIQSNREFQFVHWDEALGFMKSFLPMDKENPGGTGSDVASPGDSYG